MGIDAVGGVRTGLIASIVSTLATVVACAVLSGTTMSISALAPIFKPVAIPDFFLGNAEIRSARRDPCGLAARRKR